MEVIEHDLGNFYRQTGYFTDFVWTDDHLYIQWVGSPDEKDSFLQELRSGKSDTEVFLGLLESQFKQGWYQLNSVDDNDNIKNIGLTNRKLHEFLPCDSCDIVEMFPVYTVRQNDDFKTYTEELLNNNQIIFDKVYLDLDLGIS